MTNKSIVYLRVSTANQAKENNVSHEVQRDSCFNFATKNGLDVVKTIEHIGSGFNKDNFKPLRAAILNDPEISNIVVYDSSRLSRSMFYYQTFVNQFPNIRIYCASQSIDTGCPVGRHMMRVAISMSEYNSELSSIKIKDSIAKKKQKGVYKKRTKKICKRK